MNIKFLFESKNIFLISSSFLLPFSNLLISIIISDIYPIQDIGLFFLYNYILGLIVFFAQYGCVPFLQLDLGENKNTLNVYLSFIILNFPIAFLINLFFFLFYDLPIDSLMIFIASITIAILNIFQSKDLIVGNGLKYFLITILISLFPIFLIWILYNFNLTYQSKIITFLFIFLPLFFLIFKFVDFRYRNYYLFFISKFKNFSFVFFQSITSNLLLHLDKFIIAYFFSLTDLGSYGLIVQIGVLMIFIPISLSKFISPLIYKSKNQIALYNIFKGETLISFLLSIIANLILIFFILYFNFLEIFYGKTVKLNDYFLYIILTSFYVYSLTHLFNNYFYKLKKEKILFFITYSALIINIILSIFFGYFYSLIGIATATMISMFYLLFTTLFYLIKILKIKYEIN